MSIKAIGNAPAVWAINKVIHNTDYFWTNYIVNPDGKRGLVMNCPETSLSTKILVDEGCRLQELPIREDFESIEELKEWLIDLGFDLFYDGKVQQGTGFECNFEKVLYFGYNDVAHQTIPRMFVDHHLDKYQ